METRTQRNLEKDGLIEKLNLIDMAKTRQKVDANFI